MYTADRGGYKIAAYVLAIHYRILNRKNNRKFLHMYCSIQNMPVHLHGSSMFRNYFKYFMGTYQPVTDMQGMPIVRKYDIHANVSAKFKWYNRYAIIVYCSRYLKYVQGLRYISKTTFFLPGCWLFEAFLDFS